MRPSPWVMHPWQRRLASESLTGASYESAIAAARVNPERLSVRDLEDALSQLACTAVLDSRVDAHFAALYRNLPASHRCVISTLTESRSLWHCDSDYHAVVIALEWALPARPYIAYLLDIGAFFERAALDYPCFEAADRRVRAVRTARHNLKLQPCLDRLPRLCPEDSLRYYRFTSPTDTSRTSRFPLDVRSICSQYNWGKRDFSAGSVASLRALTAELDQNLGTVPWFLSAERRPPGRHGNVLIDTNSIIHWA